MHPFNLHTLKRNLPAALLIAGLLLAAMPQAARAQLPTATPSPVPDPAFATPEPAAAAQPAFVPGQLLVGVRQGPATAAPAAANAAAAFTTAEALAASVAGAGAQVATAFDATGPGDSQVTYLLYTEPGQEYTVANALLGQPGIVYVEPNWIVTAAQEPTSPTPAAADDALAVDVQAGFVVNDPLYAANQWNMQRVNAARAWQMVYAQKLFPSAAAVTVAVLDSGIDTTHPDFAGRLLPGYNYFTLPGSDGHMGTSDDIVNPPMRDGFGHGTHVAALIAAGLNDGVGVSGVAPQVKLAPYRVLGDNGNGSIDTVATAIISATIAGVRVINMSLAIQYNPNSNTLQDAVTYAASQGVMLVAAAGNHAGIVEWPAAYPEVMAVAALDYSDHPTVYSNFGPQVEIAAPGGDLGQHMILSAWSQEAVGRCTPNGALIISGGAPYCTRSGTSQATPLVSGAAALLFSLNPALTAADVRAILRDSADVLPESALSVGAGKLNVANALRRILPSDIVISPSAVVTQVTPSALPFTFTVTLQDPSLNAIDWSATLTQSVAAAGPPPAEPVAPGAWITMTSGVSNTQTGTLAYGAPDYLTVVISPTTAVSATLAATIQLSGTRSDGAKVTRSLPIRVALQSAPTAMGLEHIFIPMVRTGPIVASPTVEPTRLTWLAPVDETVRTTYTMTDGGSVALALPAGVKLGNKSYAAARIFADGFVALAASVAETTPLASVDTAANRCLPSLSYPAQGVFGWWADLDPSALGAQVSSFTTGDGHFVVEYADVPALGATQPYTVSFQVVLGAGGDVGLNYAHTPLFTGRPQNVSVGIEGQDALFYSLFGCATPTMTLGALPRSGESYAIAPKDIY